MTATEWPRALAAARDTTDKTSHFPPSPCVPPAGSPASVGRVACQPGAFASSFFGHLHQVGGS